MADPFTEFEVDPFAEFESGAQQVAQPQTVGQDPFAEFQTQDEFSQFEQGPEGDSIWRQIKGIPQSLKVGAAQTWYGMRAGVDRMDAMTANAISGWAANRRDSALEKGVAQDSWRVQKLDAMSNMFSKIADKEAGWASDADAARAAFEEKNDDMARGIISDVAQGVGGMWDLIPSAMSGGAFTLYSSPTRMFDEGYQQAIRTGQDPDKALDTATAYVFAASPLETAANMFLLKGKGKATARTLTPFLKQVAKKTGLNFISEGATETLQDAVLNKLTGQSMFTPESLRTFLVSGIVGSIAGAPNAVHTQSSINRRVDELKEKGISEQDAIDIVNMSIDGRHEAAKEKLNNLEISLSGIAEAISNISDGDSPLSDQEAKTLEKLAGKDTLTGDEQMSLMAIIGQLPEDEQNVILDGIGNAGEQDRVFSDLIARLTKQEVQDDTQRKQTVGDEQAEVTGQQQDDVPTEGRVEQAEELRTPEEVQVAEFAQRIAAGEDMSSLEDQQFYQNNAQAIEAELQRMQQAEVVAGELGDITPQSEEIDESYYIGISTALINADRKRRGEDVIEDDDSKAHQESIRKAMDRGLQNEADDLAARVLQSELDKGKIYQMDDEEIGGLSIRLIDLRNERARLLREQKEAMQSGIDDRIDDVRLRISQNSEKMDNIELALKTSTRSSGRAASMLASIINRFDYTVIGLENAARIAKGKDLTANELVEITNIGDKIEAIELEIKRIREASARGELVENKKRRVANEPAELTDAKRRLHQAQREARERIYNLRTMTFRDKLKNWATLPRSLMATADMSYGLRQGLLPSFAHPKIAAKAWGKAFQSFFSQNKADEIDVSVREHPVYENAVGDGIHFSNLDSAIGERTEFFASNLAEKIPGFGKIVMASERNMVNGINLLRLGLYNDFVQKHPDASSDARKAYAKYVNIATGRGEAKVLDRAAEELSIVFFAPRFAVSRIQAPFVAAQNMQHPELRAEMAKQWGSYLATGLTVLSLAKMAGADIGDDPDDSDFGKIVIGNKRIDIWGGVQQPMRILAKAIKSGYSHAIGDEASTDMINDIGRFLRYKLSPPMMMINEMVSGRDAIGRDVEPMEVGGVEIPLADMVLRNITPLIIQSAREAYLEGEDPAVIAALVAGEGLGLSIGVYDK